MRARRIAAGVAATARSGGIAAVARSAGGNAAATLVSRGVSTIAQAIAFSLVGSTFGTPALDRYALGFTIATLASLALDFGTGTWITRELALTKRAVTFAIARAPLVGLLLVGGVACFAAGVGSGVEVLAIVILSVALAVSLLAQGIFWGNYLHDREMLFAVGETCLVVALILASRYSVIPRHDPLLYTAAAYSVGAIGRWLALPTRLFHGSRDFSGWWRTMHSYGLQSLVNVASTQLDTILLSILFVGGQAGTVAAYALAMRVYYAAPMPLQALGAALLPRFVHEPSRHKRLAVIGTVFGTILAALAAAGFTLVAPVFGYSSVVIDNLRTVMEILAISFPARCVAYTLGALVTAQGLQRSRVLGTAASLTTMVALDFALIPQHGSTGAALAMVAADWVLVLAYAASTLQIRNLGKQAGLRS